MPKHDIGQLYTDKELATLAKKINKIYSEAQKDMQAKLDEFTAKHQVKNKIHLQELADGRITQADYDAWMRGQVFQGKQWQAKRDQLVNVLYDANKEASNILNGGTISVLAENANFMAYTLEHTAGVNFGFGLYDATTVTNLLKNNPDLLPYKDPSKIKDTRWNMQNFRNQITQGILQGERLDQIANRLSRVTASTNRNLMMTHARTAMTGAQNAGRQVRLEDAKKMGIKLKKEWMATFDTHTRDAHRELDGQKVDVDKPFVVDRQEIWFPADPTAAPWLVYNCRCTLVADLDDYPEAYQRYDNIDGVPVDQMTYKEWYEAKSVPKVSGTGVVNGNDISMLWHRRANMFDFEIEDVINAQGFDGLPRVVPAEEFDKYVQQANGGNGFVAQRTYTAPDQETLDMYRNELYSGKWYVDCSTGGAQYGQGMYCAADYNGKLSDGIKSEMEHYKNLGMDRNQQAAQNIFEKNFSYDQFIEKTNFHYSKDEFEALKLYRESGEPNALSQKQRELVLAAFDNGKSIEFDKIFAKESDDFIKSYFAQGGISYTETFTLDQSAKIIGYNELTDMHYAERMARIDNITNLKNAGKTEEMKTAIDGFNQFKDMDMGSYAALKGFDAINAVGHGASGSYTVVVNRTKVIFKGE